MSSNTERVRQLLMDIQQDLRHYDQLQQLLQSQHQNIVACDSVRSEEVSQQLMAIYPQLHLSAQRRCALLSALTLPADGQGIIRLLPLLPERIAQPLATSWAQLEKHVLHCQQLNQRNGLLLAMQQQSLQQLMPQQPEEMFYQDGRR